MSLARNACAYKGCNNSYYNVKGLKLYSFPKNNANVWVKHSGNHRLLGMSPETLRKTRRLCYKHFRAEDMLPSGRLAHGAIPFPYTRSITEDDEPEYDLELIEPDEECREIYERVLQVHRSEKPHRSYPGRPFSLESHSHSSLETALLGGRNSSVSPSSRVNKNYSTLRGNNCESTSQGEPDKAGGKTPRSATRVTEVEEDPALVELEENPDDVEEENPEGAELESGPSSSTSDIQFVASELTAMQGIDFGHLKSMDSAVKHSGRIPLHPIVKRSLASEENENLAQEETQTQERNVIEEVKADIAKITSDGILETKGTNQDLVLESRTRPRRKKVKVQTKARSGKEEESESSESLESAIERLDSISDKLAAASMADSYDQFGKYISSLLRGLPQKKVLALKVKIVSEVLDAMTTQDKDLPKVMKSKCVQTTLTSEKRIFKKFVMADLPLDKTQNINPSKSLPSNISMLGGNMPILFPGSSSSKSSFTLLPVIPVSLSNSGTNTSSIMTSSSLATSTITSMSNPCETVTTVAKSSDGTLLAVTIPKSTQTITSEPQSSPISPRGQKRKQTTSTFLIKRVNSPGESPGQSLTPLRDSLSVATSTSCISDRIHTDPTSQPQESTRDNEGCSSSDIDRLTQTEQDFEMDIEEGNELAQIKQDQDLFETVLCGDNSSFYIKEEAPDPDDNLAVPDGAMDTPGNSTFGGPSHFTSAPTPLPFICHLCPTRCANGEELRQHFSSQHPADDADKVLSAYQKMDFSDESRDAHNATPGLSSPSILTDDEENDKSFLSYKGSALRFDKELEEHVSSREEVKVSELKKPVNCDSSRPNKKSDREADAVRLLHTLKHDADIDVIMSEFPSVEKKVNAPSTVVTKRCPSSKKNIVNKRCPASKKRDPRERDFCYFCKTLVADFARHIERRHKSEIDVQKILSFQKCSKERKDMLSALRKKGNYLNCDIQEAKPVRKSNQKRSNKKRLPCMYCLGFYVKENLARHKQKCSQNPANSRSSKT